MLDALVRHTSVLEIVGDIIRVRAMDAALGDLAVLENTDGEVSSASVVELNGEIASLQVFTGGKGISTSARVRFLGHPQQVTFSNHILGRIFDGSGQPIDGKPQLTADRTINVAGPTVNPMMRVMPSKMIET